MKKKEHLHMRKSHISNGRTLDDIFNIMNLLNEKELVAVFLTENLG
jgi:hypothetical protein